MIVNADYVLPDGRTAARALVDVICDLDDLIKMMKTEEQRLRAEAKRLSREYGALVMKEKAALTS
jgi:hypothetical protein